MFLGRRSESPECHTGQIIHKHHQGPSGLFLAITPYSTPVQNHRRTASRRSRQMPPFPTHSWETSMTTTASTAKLKSRKRALTSITSSRLPSASLPLAARTHGRGRRFPFSFPSPRAWHRHLSASTQHTHTHTHISRRPQPPSARGCRPAVARLVSITAAPPSIPGRVICERIQTVELRRDSTYN
jgi:hypothetical protein